jgi:hypothetical protein
MNDLGVLPGTEVTAAKARNDMGQVVGTASGGPILDQAASGGQGVPIGSGSLTGPTNYLQIETNKPFLYEGGVMKELNSLLPPSSGWNLTQAMGINNKGQMIGFGDLGGTEHAFLMTPDAGVPAPVPEPGAFALLGLGLVAYSFRRGLR